jgi:16S rRNA (adenine1518-N6/adenine1519-N6)-dimethyltransferase
MVQKEIALRLEGSDSRNVSSLSIISNYYAVSEMLFHIPPSAFMPPPKVDSTFIHLTVRSAPPVSAPRELLFSLVRTAFRQRRKGIRNSLKSFSPHIDDTILQIALEKCGISPLERPQNLTLADFDLLAHALLSECGHEPADFSS